jgi:hypothetical protein
MPLETVGSTETLLQLLATYEGLNCRRADPFEIWSQISSYAKAGGEYQFYPFSDYDPMELPSEYVADLAALLDDNLIRPLQDGRVEVTPVGNCLVFARMVPGSLRSLADRLRVDLGDLSTP